MALHKLGQDPNSPEGKSPTLYYDDETGNYLIQGWKVLDEERRVQLDLPSNEDVVEFPQRMMQFFPEVNGLEPRAV
ncbi:hypothetical protein [Streptomyces sp. FH025]|uniref:hypothetical protein n=1 Tax=Streptomyces sp. FH025 TaxID=2815937 RepID=UPI001A9D1D95|nr:hypothetical protein [Streptomyces sp. FH025]MBO1415083.1 hypothetical protein [Streptomyces sp. FH025]